MSILSRPPKVDPEKTYVCLEGHASTAGRYRTGEVASGSDPGVKLHPELWLPEGTPDRELQAARNARMARAFGLTPPEHGLGATSAGPVRLARPLTVDEAVVATEYIGMTGSAAHPRKPIAVGTVLAADDPLVKRYPRKFRPAGPDDMPAA